MGILSSPYFAISLTLMAYGFGTWLNRKAKKSPLVNPIAISVTTIIVVITVTGIPVEQYLQAAEPISLLLLPATASLAVKAYKQREVIKQNIIPLLVGCFFGAVSSVASVLGFSWLFELDPVLIKSSLPKSTTTPIALEISELIGGIPAVTVALVVVTGITGALIGPLICNWMKLKDQVSLGVAFGSSSHAIGTSQALKISDQAGASSSVSILLTGLFVYLILLLLRGVV